MTDALKIIKADGDWEYGTFRAYQETYLARCSKTSRSPADAIKAAVAACPAYLSRIDTGDNLYVASHRATFDGTSDAAYRVRVDVQYLPAHLIEGNYIFQTHGMVQIQESSRDCNGNLVVVDYYDAVADTTYYQTGKFQAAQPGVEIIATGISATSSPTDVVKAWLGFANSAACWGYGEYQILCSDVSVEPWDLEAVVPKHKFKFAFEVITNQLGTLYLESGYAFYVEYKDASGNVPPDITTANGMALVYPYRGVDFNTLFPLAGRQ